MIINPTVYGGKDISKKLTDPANASDIRDTKQAVVNSEIVEGTMPDVNIDTNSMKVDTTSSQLKVKANTSGTGYITKGEVSKTTNVPVKNLFTPSISVNKDTGLITASNTLPQDAYVKGQVETSDATNQLPTPSNYLITPDFSSSSVYNPGLQHKYLTQDIQLNQPKDLKPEYILAGRNIYGVQGTTNGRPILYTVHSVTATDSSKAFIEFTKPYPEKVDLIALQCSTFDAYGGTRHIYFSAMTGSILGRVEGFWYNKDGIEEYERIVEIKQAELFPGGDNLNLILKFGINEYRDSFVRQCNKYIQSSGYDLQISLICMPKLK